MRSGKNFKAAAGKLALINGAHIKGDLVYVSDEELDISGGATVDGLWLKKYYPSNCKKAKQRKKQRMYLWGWLDSELLSGLEICFS